MSDLGERYTKNRKDQNRYHANWLNMMYPRLRVAKDLLRDDGVIFIHIDDNEVHNLRTVCDEIFGDENFINQISIKAKPSSGASGGGEDIKLKKNIEYLVCYCKNKHLFGRFNDVYEEKNLISYINEYREEGKSWKYTRVLISFGTKTFYKEIKDGAGKAIKIFKHENIEIATLKDLAKNEELTEEEVYFKYFDRIFRDTNAQSSIRQRVIDATDTDDTFYSIEYYPVSGRSKGILSTLYYKGRNKDLIAWLSDVASKENGKLIKREKVGTLWDSFNWNNVSKEGNIQYPNGKKPISFIQRMIRLCSIDDKSDIILDFFSGSGSTAHAVIAENLHDGGDRKIISIELPDLISENNKNKCYASVDLNHLNTIADICKERIRRAGEKILEENKDKDGIENLDIGFKVFRVADTNINWLHQDLKGYDLFDHYDKNASDKDKLDFMPGFTDMDVVYEIMLRQTDIPLSSKVVPLSDIGSRTYMFADSFVVCLEQDITRELVNRLAAIEPLPVKFVFRDSAFDDNIALKDETFRRLNALIEKNSGGEKQTYTVEFI
jgi:adenine-specific DNA-methyltransferase